MINQREETEVRQIISQTVDRLQRASAGHGDIGSRYAPLLELLWKPKMTLPTAIPEPQPAGPSVNRIQEPYNMQPSPRGNFSWLDLEAVGDFVCGEQVTGTNILDLSPFQTAAAYTQVPVSPTWDWSFDLDENLLF